MCLWDELLVIGMDQFLIFYGQKCAPFYNLSGSGKSVSIYENGYGPL